MITARPSIHTSIHTSLHLHVHIHVCMYTYIHIYLHLRTCSKNARSGVEVSAFAALRFTESLGFGCKDRELKGNMAGPVGFYHNYRDK